MGIIIKYYISRFPFIFLCMHMSEHVSSHIFNKHFNLKHPIPVNHPLVNQTHYIP
jgi:hypothetical protein